MAISKAQMRMLQRRGSSDIERLSQQYQKDISALTGDYEQSFAGFQAEREKQMQPYNLAAEQYKTSMADYETQAAAYRSKLGEYQATIADIEKNPSEMVPMNFRRAGRSGRIFTIDGREYNERNLPENYFLENVVVGKADIKNRSGQVIGQRDATEERLFRTRTAQPLTEKAPVAPTAPEMPELAGFDETSFQTRRGELETGFKREVGERKAARQRAVSRKTARPLLQGA